MKKGLTLIEVLLVMSVLLLMIGIMTGTLNPIALINKGKDARRKKDINRVKIAMEEYMADEGCYPADLTELVDEGNCGGGVFSPWLDVWPCDPNGSPYHLFVEDVDCPAWFKIVVYLENEEDRDIPGWWYDNPPGSYSLVGGSLSNSDVNFGMSSTNVLWYERFFPVYCFNTGQCQESTGGEPGDETRPCQPALPDGTACSGSACYLDGNCSRACGVSCCENGQPCD